MKKTTRQKVELLAPAGTPEKMEYAFAYGADAVYMGIPDFSLRVRINKFDLSSVKKAIELAHSLDKKIYVTVNIMAHNRHIKDLPKYLKKLNEWKPDALIVSDPGVIEMVKEYAPNCPIHLSTQANATNWRTVKFWHDQGVERVILGREVTLEEIKEIHKKVPKVELEYFLHGAMCMSYSGRCMLSSWLTDRCANLGDCVQPCRWDYEVSNLGVFSGETNTPLTPLKGGLTAEIEEPKRPGMKIPVEEDQHGTYIFNSKDMCMIEHLQELKDAGIMSFKIEGRAKSVSYLATVIGTYRKAMDLLYKRMTKADRKKEFKKLKKKYLDTIMNRGYTTGFLFGRDNVEQNTAVSHVVGKYQFVGEVLDCVEINGKNMAIVRAHNALRVGDKIKIMQPGVERELSMTVKKMYNEDGEKVESAHGGTGKCVKLLVNKPLLKFSILQKIKH